MKIIIVDDNKTNLMIVEKILQKAGYRRLVLLSSATELFDYLQLDAPNPAEEDIDLILMDLMMPEVDGIEACRRILGNERFRDLPIIFVTAMGDSNKMAEAMDAGALDYVMKPINKVELLARIRSVLRLKVEKDLRKERDKRIQYELDLAKQVQLSMLSGPVQKEDVTISAVYKPSFELAGDLYAWYQISPHRYGVILLDMMGHGISSSLVCMYIYSALKDSITGLCDPEAVMKELNWRMNQLHNDSLINYYFTAIYFVLDTEKQSIEYVNAGHPAGIALVDGEVRLLEKGCPALGFFDEIEVSKGVISYKDDARILLFTDGLSEWLEEEYEDAVVKLISCLQEEGAGTDPAALLQRLQPSCELTNPQKDDICLVMIATS
ncbi:PP2C family protein-serine/threonine phosphatase [Neobacillus sp. NPDC058068]|uniref:PP2C family protein-serine/threonine phosphatase n=1 Tax=Neobacillus sp. NPDC058068 TaxID=3346325 RepID=UPI0036DA8903